jgi:hypothetical protein
MNAETVSRWNDEDQEAKLRWFKSLTAEERMEVFCEMTNLFIENNPGVAERKNREARPTSGSYRVLELPKN